ncbi:MAG: RNA-binding S4 domain-containing protein [Crocinitomicaceae bacterium]|nr:RNA-binding S4 domain-containing protein [Crocinitomicaceae bacterium]
MSVRIDKFLWCVRLAKTRSVATELVKKGKVKINGEAIKPAREVKEGDVIMLSKNVANFEYKIIQLLKNRVGAKLVPDYLLDITSTEELEKYKTYQTAQRAYKSFGTGKPTKKERRAIEDFLDWTEDE